MPRRAIHIEHHALGPRLYVAGQRVHHGASGFALLVGAIRARQVRLVIVAVALVIHDRHDWRIWFAREALTTSYPSERLMP